MSPKQSIPTIPIRADDRTGVLRPENLEQFRAGRLVPDPAIAEVVDQYWHVNWRLGPEVAITQRIIDMPALTLTIEEGEVPASLVVTGVQSRAWVRTIAGQGSVFAMRLRPAGLGVLSNSSPAQFADRTVPVTPELDPALHSLLSMIATERTPEARARAADDLIGLRVTDHRFNAAERLANAVFDVLTDNVRPSVGLDLATELGVGERTIQRALKATVGRGPKWISRRIRLQEVARLLAAEPEVELSTLAIELGYTDQAHLTNDFRDVAEVSPDAYRRSLTVARPSAHPPTANDTD